MNSYSFDAYRYYQQAPGGIGQIMEALPGVNCDESDFENRIDAMIEEIINIKLLHIVL